MEDELKRAAETATGFMPVAEGLALCETADAYAAVGPVLEVGSYCGKSAIYLAAGVRAARKHGLRQQVVTVEDDTAVVIDFGTQRVRIATPCAKLSKL